MTMTTEAKRALSKTIRGLRARLLEDLAEATERAYRLSIDAKRAELDEAARVKRTRLEGWIDEQVRALPAKARQGAPERLRLEVVKDAAATLLVRLVYLRLLEASGLSPVKVVTAGWNSRGYKDFREVAPELVRADETEGYATLLGLVFDELARDLPGLFGPVRMTTLVPIPAATLRAVVDALDDAELESVWTDDTALGWVYQYWNDPEREALDAKLAASKKLENHEIASKTQMFTERYMVEWLLHNTLGQTWLAICKKHGWTARVAQPTGPDGADPSVLDQLEARRADWRAKREAGEVALDTLMPIAAGLEDRWKYRVPQPMPDDAVEHAPDSVRELKILDPACGSGHFLVIAVELLFHLYREEAWHRGEAMSPEGGVNDATGPWSDRRIIETILEHNLHGIDIDPKAVQIAAAALMLKARQLCPEAEPATLNLVAPALSLASLPDDDPARLGLYQAVEAETGIPPELTARILTALAGADHLGSLLKVDKAIDEAISECSEQLFSVAPTDPDQGSLFTGFARRRRRRITAEQAKAAVLDRLEQFLAHHTGGADLGLRLRGEQLAAGVRFVRMVREGQYDLVIGNPPYQGTSKMADKVYIEKHYPRGKADLYAAFLERGLELARMGGMSALLTMRNWMFIKQFSRLREWLLDSHDLRMLGDVDRGAFDEVPNELLAAAMSVFRRASPPSGASVAMQPTPLDDRSYDRERAKRKRAAVLCQVGRFEFDQSAFSAIAEAPLVYWWSTEEVGRYREAPKLESVAAVRQGLATSDNTRFLRRPWEVERRTMWLARWSSQESVPEATWVPFVKGAAGRAWFESCECLVSWENRGLAMKLLGEKLYGSFTRTIKNEPHYFLAAASYTTIGSDFEARLVEYRSSFETRGSCVVSPAAPQLMCALNSSWVKRVAQSMNPGVNFQVGDVNRLPFVPVQKFESIFTAIESAFREHERHRETSVGFSTPGGSRWRSTQDWAQIAVDRPDGAPLPAYEPVYDPEPATDYLSFAIGVALGRFGANGEGIVASAPAAALPHGILFLADASDDDSLAHPASAPILSAWAEHGVAIDDKSTLKNYLQDRFFPDVHRPMYENRPIYVPLSSAKRSFVAFVSIHRWNAGTLNDLLATHLYPTRKRLEGEQADLRGVRDGADKKAAKAAEKRFGQVAKWLEELDDFIAKVEACAEKGPPPPDGKTEPREVDARYEPDLDDGVMINSAALWPLLEPQWKDPKKWWKELANAEGKKDYDWSHLAARYFPTRVDAKCKEDPSLAVAHGCFWKHHPAKAYQWELRLQDEIRPDFTLDEVGSEAARATFEVEHLDIVDELVAKELVRRRRKAAKANGAEDSAEDDEAETQDSRGLDTTDEDADEDADDATA